MPEEEASSIDISVIATVTMNDEEKAGAMAGGLHFLGDSSKLERPWKSLEV